jgi:hypothetical protein
MRSFREFLAHKGLVEFTDVRPEEVESAQVKWNPMGATYDFKIGDILFEVIFHKEFYELTRGEHLTGYGILLNGPAGFESTGLMGTSGQIVYKQMVVAATKLTQTAPADHPAEFFKWSPYEPKMQLVYNAMFHRFMKDDFVRAEVGVAINKKSLEKKLAELSPEQIADVKQTLANAGPAIKQELDQIKDYKRSEKMMARQGVPVVKQKNSKKLFS